MFVYHFYGESIQRDSEIIDDTFDGVMVTESPISSFERYKEIKKIIETEQFGGARVVIKSLSFLHEV